MAACSAVRDFAGAPAEMAEHGIAPIDLVAVNLYPFEATVAERRRLRRCIENIDIGGPAMIRTAAKNHAYVAVLHRAGRFADGAGRARGEGGTTLATRKRLAAAAYTRTAAYDAAIAGWFAGASGEAFPPRLAIAGKLKQTLRYGENPHQRAASTRWHAARRASPPRRQVQGKELSYNNLNDTDAA